MPRETITELPLTDVVYTEMVIDSDNRRYAFSTATEISTEEIVSEGGEQPLKIKGVLYANKKAEDTVLGYDLTLTKNVLIPELLPVLKGGTLIADGSGEFQSYSAPPIGTKVVKEKFTLSIYSEIVDTDGPTGQYMKISFPNCEGGSVPIAFQDGSYFSSAMTIKSRPSKNVSPYDLEIVDTLPN